MKIVCPNCRVDVAADDINLSTGMAKCRTCNNVFRFDNLPGLEAPARQRNPVGKPANVQIRQENGELVIDYRWFSVKTVLMAVFCVFWMGFLVLWYTFALAAGNWIMAVFPILHVAVGLGLTYATIAGFLNTTTIRIDGSRMSVRHHPLPWAGSGEFAIATVQQLFCEEKVNRGRNGYTYTYNLLALMHDGTRKKVVTGLDAPELPLFLEQHAEAWMKITDTPVQGELAR